MWWECERAAAVSHSGGSQRRSLLRSARAWKQSDTGQLAPTRVAKPNREHISLAQYPLVQLVLSEPYDVQLTD